MASDDIKTAKSINEDLQAWSEKVADPDSKERAELHAEIQKRLSEKFGPPRTDNWPRREGWKPLIQD